MKREEASGGIPRVVVIAGTALMLWGALVLLFVAPLAMTSSITLRNAIRFGVSFWALWFFFMPAVAILAFRFPVQRKRLVRTFGIHCLACVFIVVTSHLGFRHAGKIIPQAQRAPLGPPGFRPALDVMVYCSVLGLCQAITNFRTSQERERRAVELEARLTSAKLQALRMQINPHFLFNTLNSIAALVYVNPRAADEMLGDLGVLLRRSLNSMEEQEISLGKELEFIGAYLSIEEKRFPERLRLEQSVPDELREALVPSLLLQPLVENAIRHGIERQRGAGVIAIEAKQEGKQLHLVVRDNGRGMDEARGSERPGIGLANTQARLQGLYGREQSFSIGRAEPQGCEVEIRLPLHFEVVEMSKRPDEAHG